MKEERIARLLSLVRDEYIEEALPRKKRSRRKWYQVGAAAACLLLLTGILLYRHSNAVIASKLTHVSFSASSGSAGCLAYDASELVNANPWTEQSELSTLPVCKNLWVRDGAGVPPAMDADQKEALIQSVRKKLGELSALADVTVEDGYYIVINFSQDISLPEAYHFAPSATYEEACTAAQYLLEHFEALICMEKPVMNISGGSCDIYGIRHYRVSFYEGAGDLSQQILHYNFASVSFFCSDSGGLSSIRIQTADLSEKVGEYPVISSREAEALLYDGYFITADSASRLTRAQRVQKVQLVYQYTGFEDYFMPYYEFLLESTDGWENDLSIKEYDSYYVPAIKLESLAGMNGYTGGYQCP